MGNNKIINRVGDSVQIDWRDNLHDLQPFNAKRPYNYGHLKKSILKYGFSVAFAVWQDGDKFYAIDGHTRKQILLEIESDGIEVPNTLTANKIEAKNRKEAIKILIDVYNQKHNLFDGQVLVEWIESEDVEVLEVELESVNIEYPKDGDSDGDDDLSNGDETEDNNYKGIFPLKVILTKKDYSDWQNFKTSNSLKNDTQAFLKLMKDNLIAI